MRRMTIKAGGWLVLGLLALAACGGDPEESADEGVCPDGFSLVDGACQRDGNNNGGDACQGDGDCFRGMVCAQGVCVDPENNGNPNNGDPNNGDPNNNPNNGDPNNNPNNGDPNNNPNNGDPNNGDPNNGDPNNGNPNNGGPCVADGDCEAGQVCEEGVCLTPDLEGPKLVNAFSSQGLRVTLRFDEELAAAGAEVVSNYTIQGSDNSTLGIVDARHEGRFVHLEIDPGAQINTQLSYEVLVTGLEDRAGNPLDRASNRSEIKRALYLNIIWHQHQPLYHDPVKDQMIGPWVRKHCTKDYYDMTNMVGLQPDIHFNVNLTSVLLIQLEMYVDRMSPYVDTVNNTVDEERFFAAWDEKTDPFIDFALKDTPAPPFSEDQIELIHRGAWTLVSISDPLISRFPEYVTLRDKPRDTYTQLDVARMKVFFEIAWFDPDFLQPGGVRLVTGDVVDLSDLLVQEAGPRYRLRPEWTTGSPQEQLEKMERLANRMMAENFKVMKATIPLHRELLYNAQTRQGKIEVMTTPFYHPILPLIHNTNLARPGLPGDPLPSPAYAFPDDAFAQVARAVRFYTDTFGQRPLGMWPGEGSVAEEVVEAFSANGIEWIATDGRVLDRSQPSNQRLYFPYKVDGDTVQGTGGGTDDEVLIVFRDGPLSDKIGFAYQTLEGEVASDDFINGVVQFSPSFGQPDRLLTVILDGENAWQSYTREHDGKGFLISMYRKLQQAYEIGEIITVTTSEYIHGNLDRGVPAHPITEQRELEPLWPGSWIDGTFSTWIGETEENIGWSYLLRARGDLAASGIPRPNPSLPEPRDQTSFAYYAYRAWEAIYAAEGSDWFWWFGADQETPGNDDTGFDRAFRSHLNATYRFMNLALCERRAQSGDACEAEEQIITPPNFAPIIQARAESLRGPFAQGEEPRVDGVFDPDETEWSVSAGSFFDNDSGAINNPNDDVKIVYFGYSGAENGSASDDFLYLAIDSNDDLSTKEGQDYELRIYLSHKRITNAGLGQFVQDPFNATARSGDTIQFIGSGAAREIAIDLGTVPAQARLSNADGAGGWREATHNIQVGGAARGGRVLELRVPLADLGLQLGDPVEFAVQAVQNGAVLDVAPNLGTRVMFEDVTNLIFTTFEVDVTGDVNRYVQINSPPPPAGSGTAYITGNQSALEEFVPNSVALRDDGEAPDRVANDGIWTRTFGFRPGIELRYKYTLGTPQDFGRWSNTEEFPLTERGFRIPSPDDCPSKKLRIRDTFADRPQPSGSFGPSSRMECLPQ
jgi:alpha-amylase/alpha-mannosidase (GH57 family)